jgi:ATP-dependent Lon protease
VVTTENADDSEKLEKQHDFLKRVGQAASVAGIDLTVKFDDTIHDRSIVSNSGWRINLGRGLDIFQYASSDAFDLAGKVQQYRQVKAFGVTYIRDAEQ